MTTRVFIGLTLLSISACSKDANVRNSCSDEGLSQTLVDNNLTLLLPNVITPNGDGRNERFTVYTAYKAIPPPGTPPLANQLLRPDG
jgi:hypothetical protein